FQNFRNLLASPSDSYVKGLSQRVVLSDKARIRRSKRMAGSLRRMTKYKYFATQNCKLPRHINNRLFGARNAGADRIGIPGLYSGHLKCENTYSHIYRNKFKIWSPGGFTAPPFRRSQKPLYWLNTIAF